jgi:Domain of unknown function (DUF4170)
MPASPQASAMTRAREDASSDAQRLHLVFGGELSSLDGHHFRDLDKLDIVGVYPNYDAAFAAWKAAAQRTVDNAMMRYVIVHLHRLLEPQASLQHSDPAAKT